MAIAQHGTPSVTGGGGETVTAAIPSDTSVGDLLLAYVWFYSFGGSITAPSGWTQIRTDQNLSGRYESVGLYYRFQQAGDSSFTWSSSGSGDGRVNATIVGYSGVNTSAPIDTGSVTGQGFAAAGSGTATLTGYTTVSNGDLLVLFYGFESFQADSLTGPVGWTRILNNALANTIYISNWQLAQSSAGAIGSVSVVDNTDTIPGCAIALVALVPAVALPSLEAAPFLKQRRFVRPRTKLNTFAKIFWSPSRATPVPVPRYTAAPFLSQRRFVRPRTKFNAFEKIFWNLPQRTIPTTLRYAPLLWVRQPKRRRSVFSPRGVPWFVVPLVSAYSWLPRPAKRPRRPFTAMPSRGFLSSVFSAGYSLVPYLRLSQQKLRKSRLPVGTSFLSSLSASFYAQQLVPRKPKVRRAQIISGLPLFIQPLVSAYSWFPKPSSRKKRTGLSQAASFRSSLAAAFYAPMVLPRKLKRRAGRLLVGSPPLLQPVISAYSWIPKAAKRTRRLLGTGASAGFLSSLQIARYAPPVLPRRLRRRARWLATAVPPVIVPLTSAYSWIPKAAKRARRITIPSWGGGLFSSLQAAFYAPMLAVKKLRPGGRQFLLAAYSPLMARFAPAFSWLPRAAPARRTAAQIPPARQLVVLPFISPYSWVPKAAPKRRRIAVVWAAISNIFQAPVLRRGPGLVFNATMDRTGVFDASLGRMALNASLSGIAESDAIDGRMAVFNASLDRSTVNKDLKV